MKSENDIITIEQLRQDLALKALNRAKSTKYAAPLLGISERTLLRWKKLYNIRQCPVTREYSITPYIQLP